MRTGAIVAAESKPTLVDGVRIPLVLERFASGGTGAGTAAVSST